MRNPMLRCAVLVLLPLVSACSLLSRRQQEPDPERAPVSVVIENRHWNQVTVYALTGSVRHRVGDVTPAASAEFVLPELFTTRNDMRLVVSPLASRQTYRTEPIIAGGGATVHLVVENLLRMSSWSVRR